MSAVDEDGSVPKSYSPERTSRPTLEAAEIPTDADLNGFARRKSVSQDITTSRVGEPTVGGKADQSDNIKRRLGNWTAPMAAQTAPMPGTLEDATVNLSRQTAQTASVPTSSIHVTAPISPDDASMTTKLDHAGIPGLDTTSVKVTRRMSEPVEADPAATVPLHRNGQSATPILSGNAVTAAISSELDNTVRLTQSEAAATVALTNELRALRSRIQQEPNNPDLVFELALALNEAGERTEANELLQRLITIYDASGDTEQANRIRAMVGGVVTAPIASDIDQTQVIGRNTTESLGKRTGTLSLRSSGASRDGRVNNRHLVEERERPVFSAREIVFIDELSQIDRLNSDAAELLARAESERKAGRYRSALDAIQMAIAADPSVPSVFLRMAEIQLKLGYRRRALVTIDDLQRFDSLFRSEIPEWAFARIRLHAEPFDLAKVNSLVDGLIAGGRGDIAAPYAARLVEHLVLDERLTEAQAYSDRICALAPGDTRATLEAAILSIKQSDRGGAIDRWEFALRNGADSAVAKAALAAIVANDNELDHWRLLSEALTAYRATPNALIADAYIRSGDACGGTPLHKSGSSLFFQNGAEQGIRAALAMAAGDRAGSPIGRAAAAAALARILQHDGRGDEYLAAIRTTLTLFADQRIPAKLNWVGILGFVPSIAEMSCELGQELIKAGDSIGAVEVLKQGYAQDKTNTALIQALADAYAKTNQLGSALTILDELAMAHRKSGHLDDMAAVLRQMSQLAPSNIKVKSRLVDAYLQRGFVAEARAELIQRADLEERASMIKEAIVSLQRAADLSWNLGFPQESFNLYDRILALDPEDVSNRSALVNLYLQVGRLSDAAEHQRAVVDLALKYGRKHEAIAALHQVIGLTPDDMTAYYQLGEALSSMGEYQQAEKVYRRIVLMSPDDAVAQAKATAMAALKEQASGQ
jgi:tetratricopeptide (TPR) repeat protein